MIKRIIGGVCTIIVIGVVVWTAIGFGSYRSMLPEREDISTEQIEISSDSLGIDSLKVDVVAQE